MKETIRLILAAAFLVIIITPVAAQKQQGEYTAFDRGIYYYYFNKWDSAYLALNAYIANPTDTLLKGRAYNIIGEMQWKTGDIYGAEQNIANAIKTLDPQDPNQQEEICISFNLLGNLNIDQKQYDEAIVIYNKAIALLVGSEYVIEVINGKATAFQKKGAFDSAIAIYDAALHSNPTNQRLLARIIDNRAHTKWLQDPSYPALPEYWRAKKIRTDSQYTSGLNASYAHLSDYYSAINIDSALWYAVKMKELATNTQNPDDITEALDKMIRLTKSPVLKEQWYETYKRINDSLVISRNTSSNRFAMIRYEVEKNKAKNLALEQHIDRQRLLLYALIAAALLLTIGSWSWYNKRRKRIKQESENAIRNSKLKVSQKVHDVVANGLYLIMNELEHTDNIQRDSLISRIEGLYERSRNISYENPDPVSNGGFDVEIRELLSAFAQGNTQVIVVGNHPEFWSKVTSLQQQELQLVLRELLVNMKKHSQAKKAVLQFKEEDNQGIVSYKDDGIGFAADFHPGNGLRNTVSRIKALNGTITFENSGATGVVITLRFPLKPVTHDR